MSHVAVPRGGVACAAPDAAAAKRRKVAHGAPAPRGSS
eukprot:gene8726-12286_t